MAFLPEKNFLEEVVVTSYSLSGGTSAFTSSDISKYTTLSLQFNYTSIQGDNEFILEQSNDNTNWSELSESYILPLGSGNFVIDKGIFSGKYVRINFTITGTGNITIKLLAKR